MTRCEMAHLGDCSVRIDQHHDDYNQPKVTRPLCRRHHALWHKEHGHALGWTPRRPGGRMITVYLPDDLAALVKQESVREDRTMTAIVTRALRVYYAAAQKDGKVTA